MLEPTGEWVRAHSHDIDPENPVYVKLQTREISRFDLQTENLHINEKPFKLSIFNDDEPIVYVGNLECTNYRKLAWKANDEDDAEGSLDTDNGLILPKPNAETHINLRTKNLTDLVPDDRCLEDIRAVSACRVNIASPVIMQSGADGHRHAENMRCLFGSTCLLFNSPQYLKTAGETIQQVYESRILHEEAARQQQEKARCLFEELRLAEKRHGSLRQPSFCAESESMEPEIKAEDRIQQDSVEKKIMRGFDISWKLPSGRISSLSEGLLEMPEEIIRLESHRVPASSIEKAYSEASELLATHLSRLDDRKFVFQHGAATRKIRK
ncbi:unnamed protein product [Schistocephalus solidus]|uniref:FHA domain-containing protein n=1 Tax=Schistocephalus solidus TaxID=70667 RepID=A0A183STS5_SCHSO|nr:unnamed protein product [Schistocephalus solidus]